MQGITSMAQCRQAAAFGGPECVLDALGLTAREKQYVQGITSMTHRAAGRSVRPLKARRPPSGRARRRRPPAPCHYWRRTAAQGTRTARPVTSPSRSVSSTSFTSSSGCVSVRSVTSPRAWSWSSSQRSIQLPTRLPAIAVSPTTMRDRRDGDRAAVADDRSRGRAARASRARRRASRRWRRSRGRRLRRRRSSPRARVGRVASSPSTSSAPSSRASCRRRSSVSIAITRAAAEHAQELQRDVADAADADHGRRSFPGTSRGSSLLTAW